MLRHLDQHPGGVKAYTRRLLNALLARDDHEYVFFYHDPEVLGTFGGHPRVAEMALPTRSRILWDQVAVPLAARQTGIDVLFNPKYSMALAAPCPNVWVCHGYNRPFHLRDLPWADWLNFRFALPRYAARADAIVAVSETTRQHVIEYMGVPPERVHRVYLGVDDVFRRPVDPATVEQARQKYALPERFFLFAGSLYPPKNFARLVRAFARVGPANGVHLVVAGGDNRFLCEAERRLPEELGIAEWVRWTGWVAQDELPAFYAAATALAMPSLYEACPGPILEAMAVGCRVVTSNRYGSKEVAGQTAILVDPENIEDIAEGMTRVLTENGSRSSFIAQGKARAAEFTWERCARETLTVLEAGHAARKADRRFWSPQGAAVVSRD
jgi:glycosyltransferase involved in cell wall biosynthesis